MSSITLIIEESTANKLQDLIAFTKSKDNAHVIKKALTLLILSAENKKKGGKTVLVDAIGNETEVNIEN